MEHQEAIETLASERYILGEMSDAERDSFEAHFFACEICAEDVVGADRMRAGARAGYARAAAAPTSTWRSSVVLPWAAAATLALVAGYQSIRPFGPSAGAGIASPVALSPMTLRPASRGEDLKVSARPGGVVTLAVDLGGARYERGLKYEIRNERGQLSGSGAAEAPSPGAPLLLLVPSSVFDASGRYTLTLQDPSAPESAREYRFVVDAG